MKRAVNEFERARGRIAGDFRTMITDGEDLLKATAAVSGDGFDVARKQFETKLQHAKGALAAATQPVFDMASESVEAADSYVRANPWTVAGVALAAGALLGLLIAKR